MERFLIVLPDGTELTSGTTDVPVLKDVTLTRSVNSEEELTLGCVCAAMLEAEIISPDGSWGIRAGQELTLYVEDTEGNRVMQGIFIAETPERVREHTYRLTAYDRVVLLDRDLTGWLAGLDGWPYDLGEFAAMVCSRCGVQLRDGELPNGSYQVRKFSADGVTGRHLMKWAAQIAGRFCRAAEDGMLELGWYTPQAFQIKPLSGSVTVYSQNEDLAIYARGLSARNDADGDMVVLSEMLDIVDDSDENVVLLVETDDRLFYYQGGLQAADYAVQPVEKVHLKLTSDDVGTVYPDTEEAVNTYTVSENALLTGAMAEEHKTVAQTLYEQLSQVTYTPCTLILPAGTGVQPGHILSVTDIHGKVYSVYVMEQKRTGQKDTLKCTGSARRDSTTTVNNATFQALTGKLLTLQKDVDGLHLKNAAMDEQVAQLSLTVDGIRTQMQQNESQADSALQRITTLEQTAQNVSVQIQSIQEGGVSRVVTSTGYSFSEDGLHISKSGEDMENCLDNNGMYVKRGEDTVLQADREGVLATDVTVRNYLIAGGHARFESYSVTGNDERTACFYV